MRILLIVLLLLPHFTFAEIYQWKDSKGRVHYTDSPPDKKTAKKVELEINTYEPTKAKQEPVAETPKITESAKPPVMMYATSWCGYCKKARNYFNENNIPFEEYDVEKDPEAKQRYDAIGGRGYPVILVGNQRMNGFSIVGFRKLYNK